MLCRNTEMLNLRTGRKILGNVVVLRLLSTVSYPDMPYDKRQFGWRERWKLWYLKLRWLRVYIAWSKDSTYL